MMPQPIYSSSSINRRRPLGAACLCLFGALTLMLVAQPGCERKPTRSSRSGAEEQRRRAATSGALLKAVTAQLRSLPEAVNLEVSPPVVVLDASTSSDGQDVMGTLTTLPGSPSPAVNYLSVPAGNAGFVTSRIAPNDIVKYYAQLDRESRDVLQQTGEIDPNTARMVAFDLPVAQVVDDNALIVSQSLSFPVTEPYRLEVWRISDARMEAIDSALTGYKNRRDPALGWRPSPDADRLGLVTERLNQWLRSQQRPEDWRPAELRGSLGEEILENKTLTPHLAPDALAAARFADHEGRLIQEAIWTRDIARWAGGDRFDPVALARRLFDWSVRNVTLTDSPLVLANRPRQALLEGRGTAAQRAWVFAMLCRQQRLPVVVLEIPTENGPDEPWLWCGLLHEGAVHLFDPQLGLPVPGPEADSIATLAEAKADDGLLRALDLPDAAYPVTADSAQQAAACVVASPFSLSWRAAELQRRLSGDDAVVLAVDADAAAAEAAQTPSIGEVRLWPEPFRLLRRRLLRGELTRQAVAVEFQPFGWRPRLWKARVLHFRGIVETAEDAKKKNDALYDPINDHRAAGRLYMSPSVRPSNDRLATVIRNKRMIYQRAKASATYWLGVLQHEDGSFRSADNWLQKVAAAADEEGRAESRKRWGEGVRYNRARALEAAGELAAAAELLEGSRSPQSHGDRLRAIRLREQSAPANEPSEE